MTDNINHPPHYTSIPARCPCGQPIECIQITEAFSFVLGNVIKYVWRADHKGGLEDLKKAAWYLQREIQKREGENDNQRRPMPPSKKRKGPIHRKRNPLAVFISMLAKPHNDIANER